MEWSPYSPLNGNCSKWERSRGVSEVQEVLVPQSQEEKEGRLRGWGRNPGTSQTRIGSSCSSFLGGFLSIAGPAKTLRWLPLSQCESLLWNVLAGLFNSLYTFWTLLVMWKHMEQQVRWMTVGDVSVLLVGMIIKTSKRSFEAVCLSVSK